MKTLLAASATLVALSLPAFAEGDAAKGEKEFNKCKACHMIASDSETIVKGAEGLVWDEAELATFVKNPNDYLGSRSKMTFKLAKGGEDVAAYLATFSQ